MHDKNKVKISFIVFMKQISSDNVLRRNLCFCRFINIYAVLCWPIGIKCLSFRIASPIQQNGKMYSTDALLIHYSLSLNVSERLVADCIVGQLL